MVCIKINNKEQQILIFYNNDYFVEEDFLITLILFKIKVSAEESIHVLFMYYFKIS